ncbi:hypothetical protein J4437_02200 [Candidatus Woesearchaeota archaeon]|nr:hypothetical protein [Candidatus Woesearchaeota archaeon]
MERGIIAIIFVLILSVLGEMAAYFLTNKDGFVIIILLTSLLLAITVFILVPLWYAFASHLRLNRKLRKFVKLVNVETLFTLKELYLEVYSLYLKISENRKHEYYPQIVEARKRLEEHLQHNKKVETVLSQVEQKSVKEMKKLYNEAYQLFLKLPQKMQSLHYPGLVHLRQKLEGGK